MGGSVINNQVQWNGPGITDPEARFHASLNTCNGCHSPESGTFNFLMVTPRFPGSEAELSPFMTGTHGVRSVLGSNPHVERPGASQDGSDGAGLRRARPRWRSRTRSEVESDARRAARRGDGPRCSADFTVPEMKKLRVRFRTRSFAFSVAVSQSLLDAGPRASATAASDCASRKQVERVRGPSLLRKLAMLERRSSVLGSRRATRRRQSQRREHEHQGSIQELHAHLSRQRSTVPEIDRCGRDFTER